MSASGQERVQRWYFGGLAASGAACFTHPLDLLKVQLQTQKGKNIPIMTVVRNIIKQQGVMGLYNGISASILRQMTYSLSRFGFYETAKQHVAPKDGKPMPFATSLALAGAGGMVGGFVGNPADLVNVRMQNDIKLPPEKRRNYSNAFHGIYRVVTTESVGQLWAGASMNCCRSAMMTIGQISFYEQVKYLLLHTPYFQDNMVTHITSSLVAGAVATALCQPFDVLKTRAMNAKKGEVTGITSLIMGAIREGPTTFFKGFGPAFVRIAPHTVLTFVFLEQLRMNFGYVKNVSSV